MLFLARTYIKNIYKVILDVGCVKIEQYGRNQMLLRQHLANCLLAITAS